MNLKPILFVLLGLNTYFQLFTMQPGTSLACAKCSLCTRPIERPEDMVTSGELCEAPRAENQPFHIKCALARLLAPCEYGTEAEKAYQNCDGHFLRLLGGMPRLLLEVLEQLSQRGADLSQAKALIGLASVASRSAQSDVFVWLTISSDSSWRHKLGLHSNALSHSHINLTNLERSLESCPENKPRCAPSSHAIVLQCPYCHKNIYETDMALNVATHEEEGGLLMQACHVTCLKEHLGRYLGRKTIHAMADRLTSGRTPLTNAPCYELVTFKYPSLLGVDDF